MKEMPPPRLSNLEVLTFNTKSIGFQQRKSNANLSMSPNSESTPTKGTRIQKENTTRYLPSDLLLPANGPGSFSIQNYIISPRNMPPILYRADFQQALPASSFLRTGFRASDTTPSPNPPASLASLRKQITHHLELAQHVTDGASPEILSKSNFVSLWTTRKAAEDEIQWRGVGAPEMAVEGLEGSWNVYAVSGERLKKLNVLVFQAVDPKLQQVMLRASVRSAETGFAAPKPGAEGLFLVWSEVPSKALVRMDSVSAKRMWELRLSASELRVVSEGIRLGYLKDVEEDDDVDDPQDLAISATATHNNMQNGAVGAHPSHGKQRGERGASEEDSQTGSATRRELGNGKEETNAAKEREQDNSFSMSQVGAENRPVDCGRDFDAQTVVGESGPSPRKPRSLGRKLGSGWQI